MKKALGYCILAEKSKFKYARSYKFSMKILIIFIFLILISNVYASCERDSLCDVNCEYGDLDCTCETLNGYVCKDGQNCKGNLLRNFESKVCCSMKCGEGIKLNDTGNLQYFVSEPEVLKDKFKQPLVEEVKIEYNNDFEIILSFIILFILMVIALYFVYSRNSNGIILNPIVKNKNHDLLNYILGELEENENKIVRILLKEDGLSKNELRSKVNIYNENFKKSLSVLERRQIIESRNNRIYLSRNFKQL